jgi:hypothetical protein
VGEHERRAKIERLSELLRFALIEGVEKESRHDDGLPLTDDELRRVLRRCPGDWLDPTADPKELRPDRR